MSDFAEVPLVVAFANFTKYAAQTERMDDLTVARAMAGYYELASALIGRSGGRVVKFIGDATLIVFPIEAADAAMGALLDLKTASDAFMQDLGWECRLIVKAHAGLVAAGHFAVGEDRRYDVLGKTVNVTVRLESGGVAISAEAFRALSKDMRTRFKKHTPPVTYIRLDDRHESRTARRP